MMIPMHDEVNAESADLWFRAERTAKSGRAQGFRGQDLAFILPLALVAIFGPERLPAAQADPDNSQFPEAFLPNARDDARIITDSKTADVAASNLPQAPVPSNNSSTSANTAEAGSALQETRQASSSSSSQPDSGLLEQAKSLAADSAVKPAVGIRYVPLDQCPYDDTHAKECRVHWGQLLISSSVYMAFENGGNLYTGYWYRYETTHGKWWDRYVASVEGWRWDSWPDNNPMLDDYVGHPMMGAITSSLWEQNDPKGMTLEFGNNWPYWRSRLRALGFSTVYSFAWKLGPFGEAAIGHNGDHYFFDQGVVTNETGWVELVTTPVGGFGWNVAEDWLDKHAVRSLEEKNQNPFLLTVYQFITPAKGFANILRFRPPWYRDSRVVKANSFWSDPGDGVSSTTYEAMRYARKHPESGAATMMADTVWPTWVPSPNWRGPGGRHEFGAWWGLSLISGHLWGYAGDVKYMPIDLLYSYEVYRHKQSFTLRYSPELTALAMIDWPTPNHTPSTGLYNQRKRSYGSGISPIGFQWDFGPMHKVQPFFSGNGGGIYFIEPVLTPLGSQWMYTMDFGAGISFFHHENQAITLGYRYQHLSNGNISPHNPGTDANTFYVRVSRFRNKGDRPARAAD